MTDSSAPLSSFETITLPHLASLARYAHALTRDVSAAEDLVQDTYLLAAQNWHTFIAGSECRAWLFAICRHRFLRTRKREERQEPVDDPVLEALAAVRGQSGAQAAGLEDAFERREVLDAVHDAMDALPDPFREVAVLVDLHDYTYNAAAGILGVPVGTVRSRLFRARRILQERLLAHARDLGIGQKESRQDTPQGTTR
jgi:RNA polymerase sigma-70 factor (ECF subfamily)